jgi:hypothetical protein
MASATETSQFKDAIAKSAIALRTPDLTAEEQKAAARRFHDSVKAFGAADPKGAIAYTGEIAKARKADKTPGGRMLAQSAAYMHQTLKAKQPGRPLARLASKVGEFINPYRDLTAGALAMQDAAAPAARSTAAPRVSAGA